MIAPPDDAFLCQLETDMASVVRRLEDALHSDVLFLQDALHHLVGLGKGVRPKLALTPSYLRLSGAGASDAAITVAAAVEMLHIGTLHHDDVQDGALTRRGRESVNSRWGSLIAVLSGDILLARSVVLMSELGATYACVLARTLDALAHGQALESHDRFNLVRSEADYLAAVHGKTAALLSAACHLGALAAGLEPHRVEALEAFGSHLGMAFQVVDDILDFLKSRSDLGKPSCGDVGEGVYTLPVIYALRDHPHLQEWLVPDWNQERESELRQLLIRGGYLSRAFAVAREHARKAEFALDALGPGQTRVVDYLRWLNRWILAQVGDDVPSIGLDESDRMTQSGAGSAIAQDWRLGTTVTGTRTLTMES